MITINPYLSFNGNCEEAFNFYQLVFGGEFQFVGRYKDLGAADRQNFPSLGDEKIMHISLPIAKETILMGCDSLQPDGQTTKQNNNIILAVNTDSRQEADRIFNGLSVGGQTKTLMNETFWGSYLVT